MDRDLSPCRRRGRCSLMDITMILDFIRGDEGKGNLSQSAYPLSVLSKHKYHRSGAGLVRTSVDLREDFHISFLSPWVLSFIPLLTR